MPRRSGISSSPARRPSQKPVSTSQRPSTPRHKRVPRGTLYRWQKYLYLANLNSVEPEITLPQDWPAMQSQDSVTQIAVNSLSTGQLPPESPEEAIRLWRRRKELSVVHDTLWHAKSGRLLFDVPAVMRNVLITCAHGGGAAAHQGVHTVTNRLQVTYWWPSMKDTIALALSHCDTCQRMKAQTSICELP
jgi:hypothetical protein